MNRNRLLQSCTAMAVVTAVAAACTTGTNSPSTSGNAGSNLGGSIRLGTASDVTTFDPAKDAQQSDYTLSSLQYAPLVGVDKGGKIVPLLAESWTQTPTQAVITLRPNLNCSDGAPLTATQVAASLKRYADPKEGSSSGQITFGPNGKPVITGDDANRTVTIQLAQPWSDLLEGLALPASGIVCAPGLKDLAALALGPVAGAGTGPYTLTNVQRGSSYTLTGRKDYQAWATYDDQPPGNPAETLTLSVVANESTLANQILTGQLDFAAFTGQDANRFAGNGEFTVTSIPLIRTYIMFNQRPGHPGADPKVRKAVAQAISAEAYNQVFGGQGKLLTSYVDETAACANTDRSVLTGHDPAAAATVLKGVDITLEAPRAIGGGAGNEHVAAVLKQAGANVTLVNADTARWATEVGGNQGQWDMTIYPYILNSLNNGGSRFLGEAPPTGLNFGGVDNPGFTKGFHEATSTVDQNAKCGAWQSAQKALLAEHDIVPLATLNAQYVARKGIKSAMPQGSFTAPSLRIAG